MMNFVVDTLLQASNLMLVTLGLSAVYALVRFPNLAQVEYATAGAFLSLGLANLGLPIWLAIALAAVITGVLAVVLHRTVFHRLLKRSAVIAMIGSFAAGMLIRSVIQLAAGARSYRFDLPIESPHIVFGAAITSMQILLIVSIAVILALFFALLYGTTLGRSMRAVATQPELARACGINANRVTEYIGFLGGAFAAIGGAFLAIGSQVHFNLGQDMLLPVFAAAIVGGLGSPLGAVFGVLAISIVQTLVTNVNFGVLVGTDFLYVPFSYGPAAAFALLIVTLIFRPNGLFFREVKRV